MLALAIAFDEKKNRDVLLNMVVEGGFRGIGMECRHA